MTCATGAGAVDLACAGVDATVHASDERHATQTCEVLSRAVKRLHACHLPQSGPIEIFLLDSSDTLSDGCVGRFHCGDNKIELLSPEALTAALRSRKGFGQLPDTEAFNSFLMHEVTHALIFQKTGAPFGNLAQNEYIAYALQVDFLPPDIRETLVDGYRGGSPTLEEFNPFILSLAPERFAARAWLHFASPGNGCAFIADILDGKVYFGSEDY